MLQEQSETQIEPATAGTDPARDVNENSYKDWCSSRCTHIKWLRKETINGRTHERILAVPSPLIVSLDLAPIGANRKYAS